MGVFVKCASQESGSKLHLIKTGEVRLAAEDNIARDIANMPVRAKAIGE
jgi:hypothetical protein